VNQTKLYNRQDFPSPPVSPDRARHQFLTEVESYAHDHLAPSALATDRLGVGDNLTDKLRRIGLLNHSAPASLGGLGIDHATDRHIAELIARSCFNTWLIWTQHATITAQLARHSISGTELPSPALQALRGEVLIGAALSDVRRFPRSFIRAQRSDDGWTFTGQISWLTGWGLSSFLLIAGIEEETDTVITAFVPVSNATVASKLDLSALSGSRTRTVELRDVQVPDEYVLTREPYTQWRERDISNAANAGPHHFGLASALLDELRSSTNRQAEEVATLWAPHVETLRATAYGNADETSQTGDYTHRLTERLELKARSGEILSILSRALLISRAGRGLLGTDTAQLHAKSVNFVLVQGQTDAVRTTQLARLHP
jgi:Acyl-CoA dehydrogenases